MTVISGLSLVMGTLGENGKLVERFVGEYAFFFLNIYSELGL